ncbi:MAG: NYN domain-containing protein [Thermotaleaceae bacterium]
MNHYLFVDGYNIINAWPELKQLSVDNLQQAREKLIEQMIEYQSYTGERVTIVFDAHLVKGSNLKSETINGIDVIFTKEHQTADSYIEKQIEGFIRNRKNRVRVATSDWAEQQIVLGSGATRISARELKIEMELVKKNIRKKTAEINHNRSALEERLDDKIVEILEKWRRKE